MDFSASWDLDGFGRIKPSNCAAFTYQKNKQKKDTKVGIQLDVGRFCQQRNHMEPLPGGSENDMDVMG